MTALVTLVGALLVLAGAVFIALGVPIVRLEIGWSEIIGGAVAGSAGFVVLALGAVLLKLDQLRRAVISVNVSAALRQGFEDSEPAWAPGPARVEAVAAPSAAPVAMDVPEPVPPVSRPDPVVEPEPVLAAAPLHLPEHGEHETPAFPAPVEEVVPEPAFRPEREPQAEAEPDHAPATAAHAPTAEINEGAPALLADEDHAPPLPPVEALPPESLTEPAEDASVLPPPLRAPEPPVRARPNFLASFMARRAAAERAVQERSRPTMEPSLAPPDLGDRAAPPRTPVDLSSGWDEPVVPPRGVASGLAPEAYGEPLPRAEFTLPPRPEPETPPEPVPPREEPLPADAAEGEGEGADALKPIVVGRYNAGSASYIMYSNGMIEVETEGGTHQFASMQELKAFIERRDAAKV